MTLRLLSLEQVLDRVPVSRQTIYAWIAKGEFPKQKRISANRVFWLEEEIDRWIRERLQSVENP